MSELQEEARQLIAEAETRLKSKSVLSFLFGTGNHLNRAIDQYEKAANLLKLSKKWQEAGAAFSRLAELNLQNDDVYEAAKNCVLASKCYKFCDPKTAIELLLRATDMYADMGKLVMAAKHHQIVAEIYEKDLMDTVNALSHYSKAADYFLVENSHFSAKSCLLKVAKYAAEQESYNKSIGIYEIIAEIDIKYSLLKHSLTENYYRATLCHLCVDVLNAKFALVKYVDRSPNLRNTIEYKFLTKLIKSVEDGDGIAFTQTVAEYDDHHQLDEWSTKLLCRIKKMLGDYPNLL